MHHIKSAKARRPEDGWPRLGFLQNIKSHLIAIKWKYFMGQALKLKQVQGCLRTLLKHNTCTVKILQYMILSQIWQSVCMMGSSPHMRMVKTDICQLATGDPAISQKKNCKGSVITPVEPHQRKQNLTVCCSRCETWSKNSYTLHFLILRYNIPKRPQNLIFLH